MEKIYLIYRWNMSNCHVQAKSSTHYSGSGFTFLPPSKALLGPVQTDFNRVRLTGPARWKRLVCQDPAAAPASAVPRWIASGFPRCLGGARAQWLQSLIRHHPGASWCHQGQPVNSHHLKEARETTQVTGAAGRWWEQTSCVLTH